MIWQGFGYFLLQVCLPRGKPLPSRLKHEARACENMILYEKTVIRRSGVVFFVQFPSVGEEGVHALITSGPFTT